MCVVLNHCISQYALGSLHMSFFFNDTATTEIYTLSLHDALPICGGDGDWETGCFHDCRRDSRAGGSRGNRDRKSTRLNSSHTVISYAVFCLKKKNERHLSPIRAVG